MTTLSCTDLSENLSRNSLKGDLSNDNIVNPPLFSWSIPFTPNF